MSIPLHGLNAARATGDVTQLVGELGRRVDANHDGSVSNEEFGRFLTVLIDEARTAGESSSRVERQSAVDVIGRILERFPSTPDGLRTALSTIQVAVPGASLVGPDHLEIPGVGRLNVGLSFGNHGGAVWRGGQ